MKWAKKYCQGCGGYVAMMLQEPTLKFRFYSQPKHFDNCPVNAVVSVIVDDQL